MESRVLDPKTDWCFFLQRHPVDEADLATIRPLLESEARRTWERFVSSDRRQRHPMLLGASHWLGAEGLRGPDWEASWERLDDQVVAEFLRDNVPWPGDTETLFFWMRERAVLIPWNVFTRTWRNFLYDDEGPFLLTPHASEVVWFGPGGLMGVCRRS